MQSFGLLTSGLFIPLGAVLPYVVSFYFVLALLEDSGYLPRLAVFLDTLMHRLGLHGYAIIPTLLGIMVISFGIVQDHQGELTVESEPGEYTRFHLDLHVDNEWELGEE